MLVDDRHPDGFERYEERCHGLFPPWLEEKQAEILSIYICIYVHICFYIDLLSSFLCNLRFFAFTLHDNYRI